MAQEKGGEQPLNKYARFKSNINLWYQEMDTYGLNKEEKAFLNNILGLSYGIAESQEKIMQLVQFPECGGFDLTWADALRKAVAKKQPETYLKLEKEFFEVTATKGCSKNLCNYVWKVLIAMSRGYSFNASHTLAYSLIALQEMNLAFKFPIIFWNCANLIVNSGALESDDPDAAGSTNYEKLATAIGKIREAGILVSLVDVNHSDYGFIPDVENNQILFGLKGLVNVNDELVAEIIAHRPYTSILDFMNKVKPKRQAMLSLIKGGGFDWYCSRKEAMIEYLWLSCDKKNRVTLQNLPSLMRYSLVPNEDKFIMPKRVYEFNRYLKAECKDKANPDFYFMNERTINFINEIERDNLLFSDNISWYIRAKEWDKIYQGYMDTFREWITQNKVDILEALNTAIFMEDWNKYAAGTVSAWEMDVLCFYHSDHELINVNKSKYNLSEFAALPDVPIVEKTFKRGDAYIPIYKLNLICGTCIAKNKTKATVSLLTTSGVVTVRFRKEYFNVFDKQLSIKNPDGTKSIIEKSWFGRGNMLIIQGMRRGDEFVVKKYKNSLVEHQLYHIDKVHENGDIDIRSERYIGEEDGED